MVRRMIGERHAGGWPALVYNLSEVVTKARAVASLQPPAPRQRGPAQCRASLGSRACAPGLARAVGATFDVKP